jgi:Domain of unknown function (DUF222)/HNH endonuclease
MDSNTHSTGTPVGLGAVAAELQSLAAHDLDRLTDAALVEGVVRLRRLADGVEGHWLAWLAAVDARGAAGADQGVPAGSTAGWLRRRLRMSAGAAASLVRTARALYRGPLAQTGQALAEGTISAAHAQVLAAGTQELPTHVAAEAEPVLLAAARRLDPPRLRRVISHLRLVVDPEGAEGLAERRHQQRGLWVSATWEGMVAVNGLLEAEAGQTLVAALEPLARPTNADDTRSGGQRRADALVELARRNLESGQLPQTGGVRPQLLVTVDLDSLLGHPDGVGGEAGGALPLDPEACRRLACDGAVTRVLVTRHPTTHQHPDHRPDPDHGPAGPQHQDHPETDDNLAARLQAAATRLPPTLGGAPTQPLEVGRTSRVVSAAQRAALVVRDGGCAVPGCDRPPAWCEAHHLVHWLHGGPTDLENLALVCRAHHRAVHEGGWRLGRDPDGRLTATPPHRKPPCRRLIPATRTNPHQHPPPPADPATT